MMVAKAMMVALDKSGKCDDFNKWDDDRKWDDDDKRKFGYGRGWDISNNLDKFVNLLMLVNIGWW